MEIGIIGCGKQGERHLRAFRALPEVAACAVADIEPARSRALSCAYDARHHASPGELLADPQIDAVVIATPTLSHGALIRAAIASGKHFLCEKPLDQAHREAQALISELDNAKLVGRIAYLYRVAPAVALGRDLIARRSAILGKIEAATFHIAGPGSHRRWKHWRGEGGGALNELAAHMLDLALWYFGPVREIESVEKLCRRPRRVIEENIEEADAEDWAALDLTMKSGVKVRIECDFAAPRFAQSVEIVGDNGVFHGSIDPSIPCYWRLFAARGGFSAGTHDFPVADENLYLRQAQAFLDAIAKRPSEAGCTLAEGAAISSLLETLRAAPITAGDGAG